MHKRFIGLLVLLTVGVMLPIQVYAATPQETVENGVNKVLKTLADPAFQAKPKEVKI
jgi:ABC-type transporter MlaC component